MCTERKKNAKSSERKSESHFITLIFEPRSQRSMPSSHCLKESKKKNASLLVTLAFVLHTQQGIHCIASPALHSPIPSPFHTLTNVGKLEQHHLEQVKDAALPEVCDYTSSTGGDRKNASLLAVMLLHRCGGMCEKCVCTPSQSWLYCRNLSNTSHSSFSWMLCTVQRDCSHFPHSWIKSLLD